MIEIRRLASPEEVASHASQLAARDLKKTLESHQFATFALAGGRLPPLANRILAKKYADFFDWKRVLFLIGDERCVPLDDPNSSWHGALPLFEAHPEIPATNQLQPQSQLTAEAAAEKYTKTLLTLRLNKAHAPIINHLWLGVGEDGHTLSLFPDHPSLAIAKKTDQIVIPVHNSPKPPSDRISLSFRALEGVETAVVFISGTSKAPIMAQVASGDHSLPIVLASRAITKAGGRVIWLADTEALSQIPTGEITSLRHL